VVSFSFIYYKIGIEKVLKPFLQSSKESLLSYVKKPGIGKSKLENV
jgi:hypothetical protein